MFDSLCDLAALVYQPHQDPDEILREFAAELNGRGYRAVGLVQFGHHCVDANLFAMPVHTGEKLPLLQDLGSYSAGSTSVSCLMPVNGSRMRSMRAPIC